MLLVEGGKWYASGMAKRQEYAMVEGGKWYAPGMMKRQEYNTRWGWQIVFAGGRCQFDSKNRSFSDTLPERGQNVIFAKG